MAMNKFLTFLIIGFIFLGIGFYLWQGNKADIEESNVALPVTKNPSSVVKEPVVSEILYPVPQSIQSQVEVNSGPAVEVETMPLLDDSDGVFREELGKIFSPERLAKLFLFEAFVRHLVVTVDNLDRKKLPQRFVLTQRPVGKFMVEGSDTEEVWLMDNRNYERYAHFVEFANIVETEQLVSIYTRYYFLFQEAYEELGYPNRYFNDRLVEIIDHLIATPEVKREIKLIQPKVFYQFADPDLEALSAGQKVLLRIGYKNATEVKARLKELRQKLTVM